MMSYRQCPAPVLMAEDDPDDRLMVEDAMRECGFPAQLRFVEDGEELLDYLHQRGKYRDSASSPRPRMILLDLNMPRKDGRQALAEIKADPELRSIPVVVLTTSNSPEDVHQTYDQGASSYITKPPTFRGLVETLDALSKYWFHTVMLPNGGSSS